MYSADTKACNLKRAPGSAGSGARSGTGIADRAGAHPPTPACEPGAGDWRWSVHPWQRPRLWLRRFWQEHGRAWLRSLAGIGAVLALGAVAQVGLPAWSVLAQAKVQFLALIGLYYAVRHDSAAVPVCAFLAGLLHDSLSPVPLGHSSLILCLGCWLVGRQRQRLVWDRYRTQVLLGGLGTAVYSLALGLLLLAGRRIEYSVWQILVKAGATGLLGGLFAPGVFQVLAWCEVRVPWLLQEVRRACDCAVCPRPRG